MSCQVPPPELMESLLRDPMKRALILKLLNKEKQNLEKYKRQEAKATTPVKKLNEVQHCESPTALQRRRALLDQKNQETTSESSSSDISEVPTTQQGPKLPFEALLKGVIAYIEVKRDNQDRSEGIRAIMKLMGATIRDTFTNDVTHVIFKDGSFTTFEKAKLMKIHLVSVLWLDAVRRYNARVPERNYPAFGNKVSDENVSILCSQIQKDYEDVVKDERRRRRTMMTPKTSMSSYLTAQNLLSEDEDSKKSPSPELTSDDSDCGVIDGHISKKTKDLDLLESSTTTTLKTVKSKKSSENSESSASASLLSCVSRSKRKTINVLCNMELTPNVPTTRQNNSSEQIVENTPVKKPQKKTVSELLSFQSSAMSSLRVSDTDKTKSDLNNSKGSSRKKNVSSDTDRTKSDLRSRDSSKTRSSLLGGKENNSVVTLNTTMSSLRLSDSSKSNEKRNSKDSNTEKVTRASIEEDRAGPSECSSTSSIDMVAPTKKNRRKTLGSSKKIPKEPDEPIIPKKTRSRGSGPSSISDEENFKTPKKNLRKKLYDSSNSEEEKQVKKSSVKRTRKTMFAVSSRDDENDAPIRTRTRRSVSLCSRTSDKDDVSEKNESPLKTPPRKRSASIMSKTSEKDDNVGTNKIKTDGESDNGSANRTRKKPLVVSSKSVTKAKVRRSMSEDRVSSQDNVSPPGEVPTSRMNRTPIQATPSPAKKSRIQSTAKKTRKLYNPTEIPLLPNEDDKEREESYKQMSQKSPDGVFLNPNNIEIAPLVPKRKPNTSDLDSMSSGDETSKKNKKGRKKKSPKPVRDSDADEQRDLLDLLNEPKSPEGTKDNSANEQRDLLDLLNNSLNPPSRRSNRSTLTQMKAKYNPSSLSSNDPITPIKRRSTLDFVPVTMSQKRKLKLDPKRVTSIVCTKMHRHEVARFEKIVANIGKFFVEDKVTGRTSHLVAGEAKRTINMLRAIARGCWIVKHDWLLKSQQAGRWLNEEDYELTEFSPAVQQCRLQREAFGALYSMDIFKDIGTIYVGKDTCPKPADLKELISICKGNVTTIYRNAKVVVGEYIQGKEVTCVTEMWVLDSILYNKLKGFKNYLLKPPEMNMSSNSPHF